jgi:uncharacterized protein YkwD
MKASILLAALAAIAVPATAAPVKRDAAPIAAADAQLDWSNGNPFGKWNDDGTFDFTINWSDAVSRWRTRRPSRPQPTAVPQPQPTPAPQPTPVPEQPAPEPEQPAPEQPAPQPEQPAPEPEQPAPEQPAPQPEQPVDQPPAEERPADAPTGGSGQPTLPFADDKTVFNGPSGAADIAGTSAQAKLALDYHNQWRAQFGVGPLTWDAGLAQKASDHMKTCKWEHIGADNLSARWGSGNGVTHLVHSLIDGWADEWKKYDWNNPGFAMATGHFTAMTWKASTKIGCGWNIGCKDQSPGEGYDQKIYFQCIYDPTPNMGGYDDASTRKNYETNVPRYVGN